MNLENLIKWHTDQCVKAGTLRDNHEIQARTFKRNPAKYREALMRAGVFSELAKFHSEAVDLLNNTMVVPDETDIYDTMYTAIREAGHASSDVTHDICELIISKLFKSEVVAIEDKQQVKINYSPSSLVTNEEKEMLAMPCNNQTEAFINPLSQISEQFISEELIDDCGLAGKPEDDYCVEHDFVYSMDRMEAICIKCNKVKQCNSHEMIAALNKIDNNNDNPKINSKERILSHCIADFNKLVKDLSIDKDKEK